MYVYLNIFERGEEFNIHLYVYKKIVGMCMHL